MSEVQCPACGGEKFTSFNSARGHEIGLDIRVDVELEYQSCLDCGFEGDVVGVNDDIYLKAKQEAETKYIAKVLDVFRQSYTNGTMERALGLSPYTFRKWEAGNHSAPTVTLLKVLYESPDTLKYFVEKDRARIAALSEKMVSEH